MLLMTLEKATNSCPTTLTAATITAAAACCCCLLLLLAAAAARHKVGVALWMQVHWS
jgi:hypothetical protein